MRFSKDILFYLGYVVLFFPLLLGNIYVYISFISFMLYFALKYSNCILKKNNILIMILLICALTQSLKMFNLTIIIYSIIPFLFLALFYINKDISFNCLRLVYIFKTLSVITSLCCLFQFFYEPTLFGIAINKSANIDTHGTSSFRVSGFYGSSQNCALLFGSSIFLSYQNRFYNILSNTIIISSGLLTLSTFFGACLLIYVCTRHIYMLLLVFPLIPFIVTFDFRNTLFESFSFIEVLGIIERYTYQSYNTTSFEFFFGHGLGTASQGIIDRGLSSLNILESESSIEVFFYERGIIFLFVLLFIILISIINSIRSNKCNITLFLCIILLNMFLVPAFSSLKSILIYFPFYFLRLKHV